MNNFSLNWNVCIRMLMEYFGGSKSIPHQPINAPGQNQNRSHGLCGGEMSTNDFAPSHPL